jgi:cellulose synthase/poly-beta-1,6-N-acetylglucosamine synthase-like glycosyltransferase
MGELAHVTVQLPVYKESLEDVIIPTVESLKRAITTYERQGGSVGILVCDDGLQLLDQAEADKRRQYYFNNSIAYVARPGHNVDGFQRKGRFKKAGNMNFANALSLRVEEIMDDLRPTAKEACEPDHFWSDMDENLVYESALAQGLEESKGKAWAAGNIRFGPIILIIDSDTRVPEDCFADAVSEMVESPEVAIIQHMSGVMQVAHHFFENGVAHFTKGIQTAISYVCASGEGGFLFSVRKLMLVAPFVGHNAFIRWSALQECLELDPDDGVMKIWSEAHVSEDFQIAITLQTKVSRCCERR